MKTRIITKGINRLTCFLAAVCLLQSLDVNAQNITLGSDNAGQLKIEIGCHANGTIMVSRGGSGQMYLVGHTLNHYQNLFGLRIDGTNYMSNYLSATVEASVTTGTQQYAIIRFSGTHEGNPFSVLWTIHYNTTRPEHFTSSAEIDASAIPSGKEIRLAYGYGVNVDGCYDTAAMILPDPWGYNGGGGSRETLSVSDVQTLRLVAGRRTQYRNGNHRGVFTGFFTLGRSFDMAQSSTDIFDYSIPYRYLGGGDDPVFNMRFAAYDMSYNATATCTPGSDYCGGIAVRYNYIPTGEITTIRTGWIFAEELFGEIEYSWNNWTNKDRTLTATAGGSAVNLLLRYTSYGTAAVTGLGFQVNLPSGIAINGSRTYSGFTSFASTGASGNVFRVTSANIGMSGSVGNISIPITTGNTYGQYVIDANSISNAVKTLPLGVPATLTVTSEVNYASTATVSTGKGQSAGFTVKLPDGVVANGALTVNLSYAGTVAAFSTRPASVTIPSGQNSATFYVVAASSAADNSSMTITLSGTDHPAVTVGSGKTVSVRILTPVLNRPADQVVCGGDATAAVSFTGTDVVPAQCSWTVTNYAALGLQEGTGVGNIPALTTVNTGTADVVCSFTVAPQGGSSVSFNVTIRPQPAAPTAGVPPASICAGNTGSVSVTPREGTVVDWYNSPSGGTLLLAGSDTYATPVLTAPTGSVAVTYYAESRSTATGCVSASRTAMSIMVNPCVVPVNPHLQTRVVR
jgi:hypothetical protein